MEAALPNDIRRRMEALFARFQENPNDPILENSPLHDSGKGRHRNGSYAVRITLRYRAIYVVDRGPDGRGDPQACWYWVGSREDYANFVGCR